MTGVDFSLLVGLAIAGLISWRNRRGLLWLGAAALSYAVSVIYWRSGLPRAEAIAGLCDTAACLAIYFWGRYSWELWIWRLFQVSLAINIFYLAGNLGVFLVISHEFYSIMLEAMNWLVLLSIGGTSALQGLGVSHVYARRPWDRVRGALLAVWAERKKPSFLAARRQ